MLNTAKLPDRNVVWEKSDIARMSFYFNFLGGFFKHLNSKLNLDLLYLYSDNCVMGRFFYICYKAKICYEPILQTR